MLAQNLPWRPHVSVCEITGNAVLCRLFHGPLSILINWLRASRPQHGVLGVECSNHSDPTIFFKGLRDFISRPFFIFFSFLPLQNHWLWVESSRLPRGRTQALALTRGLFTNVDWSFSSGPDVFECLRLFSCVLRTTYRSTISLYISGRSGHPTYPVVRLGRHWDRIAVGD